ncbi:MAG: DEAD/DEAH box helicase, partial [Actinobacteria bacterium]|nr:DEAD/DEAH box helicase [Actinomycetota bacterium]
PDEFSASDEILGQRLRLCRDLLGQPSFAGIISTSGLALIQPLPSPSALKSDSRRLICSQTQDRDELLAWLVAAGYDRVDMVETPGDFAVRGGVVDVFITGWRTPARIEFVGDTIESIRSIDLDTQRSSGQLDELELSGAGCSGLNTAEQSACLFDYLPPETIIVWNEPLEIAETAKTFLNRLDSSAGYHTIEYIFRSANSFHQLDLTRFGSSTGGKEFSLPISSVQHFETDAATALRELSDLAQANDVYVFCDNPSQRQRLTEMFAAESIDFPKRLHCPLGFIHQGFRFSSLRMAVVGHHEIFHRYQRRRRIRPLAGTRPVDSFAELNRGDYVVHITHGIGRFEGLKTIERDGRREEFLSVRFAAGAVLHVPSSRVDLIQRYIGGFRGHPPLSKLGSSAWRKQKDRVTSAVIDLAAELLQLQAKRQTEQGIAYPPDSSLQREFEASFIYQETPDQLTALEELKGDMCRSGPMERLLCGDVGYGKTELAIRAAFKAVEAGRQVAVLVPTTVLAQQHYRTFSERLADYPFLVEVLSRFCTASQQKKVVARAATGRVDIVIGTHRLLSNDVRFANLGLVIIDEEQRFGVEHKERLKHLRETVDVLTMTATPIPRTLHMGLMGLRFLLWPALPRIAAVSPLKSPPMTATQFAQPFCGSSTVTAKFIFYITACRPSSRPPLNLPLLSPRLASA